MDIRIDRPQQGEFFVGLTVNRVEARWLAQWLDRPINPDGPDLGHGRQAFDEQIRRLRRMLERTT